MNKKSMILGLLVSISFAGATLFAAEDAKKEVAKVLDNQVAAWNGGSIDEFMRGYEVSESTVFTSGARVVRGWKNMLDRYRSTYGSGDLGKLQFSEIEVTVTSKDAALVLGRWQLQRADQKSGGVFTLLFRKTRAGWRIVHDHTSTSQ